MAISLKDSLKFNGPPDYPRVVKSLASLLLIDVAIVNIW